MSGANAGGRPRWLRAVLRLERAIGEPLEGALHSDTYFDLVAETLRLRGRTTDALEAASRRALHLLNLPAGSDIRRLRLQLGRIERQLAQVAKELEDASPDGRDQLLLG